MSWSYTDQNRIGDHIWWIGDNSKFAAHYPNWQMQYNVERIMRETYEANLERWGKVPAA
ncbi:MAG: hypothetical protein SFU83_06150 [Meiothermus sp.]|nr:hypothetical protein [Meiothermus sp.]